MKQLNKLVEALNKEGMNHSGIKQSNNSLYLEVYTNKGDVSIHIVYDANDPMNKNGFDAIWEKMSIEEYLEYGSDNFRADIDKIIKLAKISLDR